MGGAIFAQPDGVVGINKNASLFHQGGHTHRVPGVFHEHQERGAIHDKTTVQHKAIHDSAHTKFANAIIQVVPRRIVSSDALATGPQCEIGSSQVCRTTQQFRQQWPKRIETVLRGFAGGHFFHGLLTLVNIGIGLINKCRRQVPFDTPDKFNRQIGVCSPVALELLLPVRLGLTTLFTGIPATINLVWHIKGAMVPLQLLAGQ